MNGFEHPASLDLPSELDALQTRVTEQVELHNALVANGFIQEATHQTLRDLREIADRAREAAISASLNAISEGTLSQTATAELLDVHPITVGRWVKAARAGKAITPRQRRYEEPPQL